MKIFYITFRSVTYAQRGDRILQEKGIRSILQRTPKWMEEQGCGYALRIRADSPDRALEILRRNKVPYKKVYVQQNEGVLEERML